MSGFKYKKGDRIRVVTVPQDGDWPMKVGQTGTVVEDQDEFLPYVRVDIDLARKGTLFLSCELEMIDTQCA